LIVSNNFASSSSLLVQPIKLPIALHKMSLSRSTSPLRNATSIRSARAAWNPSVRYFTADQALDLNSAPPSASSQASSSSATASSLSSAASSDPTHFLITLKRSSIGLPKQISGTLDALGLGKKLHRSVLHPYSPDIAGQILAVKELVQVKNVTEEEGMRIVTKQGHNGERRGWEVVGRAPGTVRS
jgi:large subunit ribosomal protein L30